MYIKVLNHIWSSVSTEEEAIELSQVLKYKTSVWRVGPFSKTETVVEKSLVHKGKFLTGYLGRIKQGIKDPVIDISSVLPPTPNPNPPTEVNISLEGHQTEAIKNMLFFKRGVIHYPTASGKTVIFLYFISLFPNEKSLIIVHTQDLLLQTYERAIETFGSDQVGIIGGGHLSPKRITVGMIQTLKSFNGNDDKWFNSIGIVIVDEAHHISKFAKPFTRDKGGTYAQVLSKIPAPYRFGFTATLPYIEQSKWALEGYIGPVIAKKKFNEVERVAKIKIKLKMLPITQAAKDSKLYRDAYQWAVVFNSRRHRQVLLDTQEDVNEGRTVLILVTQIQHGTNIMKMALRSFPQLKIKFVWGKVDKEDRKLVKDLLNRKQYDVVIANTVWKEGIDIPTLGAINNAAGGKSEILTLQNLGRGLRTVPGIKDEVILRDYFDPSNRYLVEHFGYRITLYFQEEWL